MSFDIQRMFKREFNIGERDQQIRLAVGGGADGRGIDHGKRPAHVVGLGRGDPGPAQMVPRLFRDRQEHRGSGRQAAYHLIASGPSKCFTVHPSIFGLAG